MRRAFEAGLIIVAGLLLTACVSQSGGKPAAAKLVINELMIFPEGGGVQWVELFNPNNNAVSLSDYSLVGSQFNAKLSGTIQPNSYFLAVFAQNAPEENDAQAVSGSLNEEKDEVVLRSSDSSAVDRVAWDFSNQTVPDEDVATVRNGFFVRQGTSIARDRNSRDTNALQDWFGWNGIDSLNPTPGEKNFDEIATVGDSGEFQMLSASETAAAQTVGQGTALASSEKPCGKQVSFAPPTNCNQIDLLKQAVRLMQQTCNTSLDAVSQMDPDDFISGPIEQGRTGVDVGIPGVRVRMGRDDSSDGGQAHPSDRRGGETIIDLHNNTFECSAEKLKIIFYHELVHEKQFRRADSGLYGPDGSRAADGQFIKPSLNRLIDCYEAEAWLETLKKLQLEAKQDGADMEMINDLLAHGKKQFLKYWSQGIGDSRQGCSKYLQELQKNLTSDGKKIRNPRALDEYRRAREEFGDSWLQRFHDFAWVVAEKYVPDKDGRPRDLTGKQIEDFVKLFLDMNLTYEEIADAMKNYTTRKTFRKLAGGLGLHVNDLEIITPPGATARPGDRVSYSAKVVSFSDKKTKVNVTILSMPGWMVGDDERNVVAEIAAFGELDLQITVVVPEDAHDGDRDLVNVNVHYGTGRNALTLLGNTIVTVAQREYGYVPGGGSGTGGEAWAFATSETPDSVTATFTNNGQTDSLFLVSKNTPDMYYQHYSEMLSGKRPGDVVVTLETGDNTGIFVSFTPYADTPAGTYSFEWVLASSRDETKTFTISKTITYAPSYT